MEPDQVLQGCVPPPPIAPSQLGVIEGYVRLEATNFQGPMYADPARALYKLFGFTETLALTPSRQEKPSYVARSLLGNVFRSIWVRQFVLSHLARPVHMNSSTLLGRSSQASWNARKTRPFLAEWRRFRFWTRSLICIYQLWGIQLMHALGNACTFASVMKHTEDRKQTPWLVLPFLGSLPPGQTSKWLN